MSIVEARNQLADLLPRFVTLLTAILKKEEAVSKVEKVKSGQVESQCEELIQEVKRMKEEKKGLYEKVSARGACEELSSYCYLYVVSPNPPVASPYFLPNSLLISSVGGYPGAEYSAPH